MNVLAVGCHPDDVEIACSGTLAKRVKRGDNVTMCHVANGNLCHEIIKPDALRDIRAMDTLANVVFNPSEYVDISEEIDLKINMLECHERQLKWMRDHDGIDFAEFVRTYSRFCGLQRGVMYAEAFSQADVLPKIIAGRLLP